MSEVIILARLAWLRLWRGRTKWLSGLLALLPPIFAALLLGGHDGREEIWEIVIYFTLSLAVLIAVAVQLAPSVGDELESRTYTYLWSRPVRRSALLLGKLLATTPPIAAAFVVSESVAWAVVWQADAGAHVEQLLRALLATLGVVGAGAALALATSALLPRRPLAFVLGYIMLGEQLLGFVPLLRYTSISFHASAISAAHPSNLVVGTLADGLLGLAVLTVVWLGLAIWRVERAEYALPDG
jgi:ABC-type transport system involved in multi-copper enzyme maturation permease subunit